MNIDYEDIGRRVKEARKRLNVTQAVLSERAGISPTNLSHIETGKTKLSLPVLVALANALDLSPDELLCGSLKKASHVYQAELLNLVSQCGEEEIRVISDTVKALKESLRRWKAPNTDDENRL